MSTATIELLKRLPTESEVRARLTEIARERAVLRRVLKFMPSIRSTNQEQVK